MGKFQPYVVAAVTALLVISVMMNMLQHKSLLLHSEYTDKLIADKVILEKNEATLQRGIDKYQEALTDLIALENSSIAVLVPTEEEWSPAALLINNETGMMFFSRGNEQPDHEGHMEVWGLKAGKAYDLGPVKTSPGSTLQNVHYVQGLDEVLVTLETTDSGSEPSRDEVLYSCTLASK